MKADSPGRILVVDDEPQVRNLIASVLQTEGYQISLAECGQEACKILTEESHDVVFTDLRMPNGTGMDVLRHIQQHHMPTLGVIVTGYGTFESAIEAIRVGAFDYLTKPLHLDEIKRLAREALQVKSARKMVSGGRGKSPAVGRPVKNILGKSQEMKSLNHLIATVAQSSATVLIRGESGTGKELVARALHYHSPRRNRPLVPVNCGAIPEDLLESELFGHVKGAFTGAMHDRVGRFVLANGGTIFLDEIGDMSPRLQVKVLRVLQEQELEPVGSAETIKVDVRILAATNVNLERAVEEKRFREDLYYRLNVIPIVVPPLRERLEDLPILIDHFISRFNQKQNSTLENFAPETIRLLQAYRWPGNVRELENLVERMTVLVNESIVKPSDLPEKFHASVGRMQMMIPLGGLASDSISYNGHDMADSPEQALRGVGEDFLSERSLLPGGNGSDVDEDSDGANLNDLVDRFERDMILKALEQSNGVKNRAAQLLGIKRTTLVEKMKKKNITFKRV